VEKGVVERRESMHFPHLAGPKDRKVNRDSTNIH
jgi:hypothetical protein